MSTIVKRSLPVLGLAAVLILVLFNLAIRPAAAAGFVVNSTADTGDNNPGDGICADSNGSCTLRAAIDEANALAGADDITLPAGTYSLALAGASEDGNATGDLDITDDLTINGGGMATTIVNGGALDRVFHIVNSSTVIFNDFTIENGHTPDGVADRDGGGVFNNGDLTLNMITVDSCTAGDGAGNADGGRGGGVFHAPSAVDLTVIDSAITNNQAGQAGTGSNRTGGAGGGLYSGAPAQITGSTISANAAGDGRSSSTNFSEAADGGDGGGIAIGAVDGFSISDSLVDLNEAGDGGDCTAECIAGDGGDGAGIFVGAGADNINLGPDLTVSNGTTGSGGSCVNQDCNDLGQGGDGGGIYVDFLVTALIQGALITGNATALDGSIFNQSPNGGGNGGGIYSDSNTLVTESAITLNTAEGRGGGIYDVGSSFHLEDSIVSRNEAKESGGGVSGFQNLFVIGSTISDNTAGTQGGGIIFDQNNLYVINSTVSGNVAATNSGGGILSFGSVTMARIRNSTVTGNSAATTGDGVYNTDNGTMTIDNTIIAGNDFSDCVVGSGSVSGQNNLIQNAASDCGLGGGGGNITGVDPMLAPLAFNGGPTPTHALLVGSQAIDNGQNALAVDESNVALTTDQRSAGFPRIVNAIVDIGAYELGTGQLTIAKETDPTGGTGFPFTVDPGDYSFDLKWGTPGDGNGQFDQPNRVAVDATGNVYVADTGNNRIQKFDGNGAYVTQWGTPGSGNGEFSSPNGVAVDAAGNVYVSDTGNDRIQKFDGNGAYVTQWGSTGSGDGQFRNPVGVAADAVGNVYVADTVNNRIQKFDSSGAFITKWGTSGNGDGQFNGPAGVAVDAAGNVYVVDTYNERIQKFDSSGGFVTKWGGGSVGEFTWPEGVAVDAAGNVYVADTVNDRIVKFDTSGVYLTQWGSSGSGDGQLDGPSDVAVDAAGNVYVAEYANERIQVFSPDLTTILDDGQSDSFILPPGDYLVSELVPDGWTVDQIDCDGGSPDYGDTTVGLTLAEGDDVTCTFSNIQPIVSICPVDDAGVGSELTTLLGAGMGSPTRSKMVAKVVIPNAAGVTDLYGQMAAKEYNGVKYVRFIFGDKSFEQVQPETDLGDIAAISWWGADLTTDFQLQAKPFVKGRWFLQKGMKKMRIPRAIVFYATHDTGDADYANAWSTFTYPDNFVAGTPGFDQTNTNVLAIPETQATTDIVVQLAVTDVNRDPRTIDVIVRAGGVEVTTTLTGPTNTKSELLNLFEVTLEDVPAGVDEVEMELVSVLGEGDSAALLGAAAHYECGAAGP